MMDDNSAVTIASGYQNNILLRVIFLARMTIGYGGNTGDRAIQKEATPNRLEKIAAKCLSGNNYIGLVVWSATK